ncbi:antiviral reverse transcriptase Drt3b [Rhodococcus erythropolis]
MKNRHKKRVHHTDSRVVLSEILPYEVPVSFSNTGLYRFFNATNMSLDKTHVRFNWKDTSILPILKIIFGSSAEIAKVNTTSGITFSIPIKMIRKQTIPFHYHIKHKNKDSRQLSIAHPTGQIAIVDFYRKYSGLILYYTSRSPYSVRYPKRPARHTLVRDNIFENKVLASKGPDSALGSSAIETDNLEYETLRSYFVYHRYENIHKFYESEEYRYNEKRFGHLLKLDIAKCFDSVYTHAISWAVHDKEFAKKQRNNLDSSFAGEFDKVIQNLNDGETHGIPIGPEVSRIFAEIILQDIDVSIEKGLSSKGLIHRRDYEIMRYVDDYFIFVRDPNCVDTIVDEITEKLRPFRFHLNIDKTQLNTTPFISDMTIAKSRIRELMTHGIFLEECTDDSPRSIPSMHFKNQDIVAAYKTILRETGLNPIDLVNFTLASLEISLESIVSQYTTYISPTDLAPRSKEDHDAYLRSDNQMMSAISKCTELAYYIYGGSPRVAPAIKLARIVALSRKCVSVFDFSRDNRDSLDDLIYRETLIQLNRNPLEENCTIEALYLLNVLGQLDDHYMISEADLHRYFSIEHNNLVIPKWYNVMIVSNILQYIKLHDRYSTTRDLIESWAKDRVDHLNRPERPVTEQVLLCLTMISCPYISQDCKKAILSHYGTTSTRDLLSAATFQQRWFVDWSDSDLYAELLQKRVQDVY